MVRGSVPSQSEVRRVLRSHVWVRSAPPPRPPPAPALLPRDSRLDVLLLLRSVAIVARPICMHRVKLMPYVEI